MAKAVGLSSMRKVARVSGGGGKRSTPRASGGGARTTPRVGKASMKAGGKQPRSAIQNAMRGGRY